MTNPSIKPEWQDLISPRLAFAFLFLIGIAFYANSWSSYFVCDDYEFLGRVNLHNAGQYFHQTWAYGNEYRPLLPFSYALDALFSGDNPIGYHITNTLLQVVNAWLVFLIAIQFALPKWPSLLAGVLFLLNPVSHEAFLWISGRPVMLSTSLQLLSIWCLFGLPDANRRWRTVASLACLVLALLTYEGAIALPFVLLVLSQATPALRQRYKLLDMAPFFVVLALYLLFWFWLFNFRLIRTPQDSALGGLAGFLQALLHSWHGAYRLGVGLMYLVALAWFLRNRVNRAVALLLSVVFIAAFLPFFVSKGFAPRFDYFPGSAACVLLALVLYDLFKTDTRLGAVALVSVLVFYGVGMQSLIGQWRGAGEIARGVPQQILRLQPALAPHSTIALAGVPLMYKHAYVYLTGLPRAMSRAYAEPVKVIQTKDQDSVCSASADYHFQYKDGHMAEVQCDSPQASRDIGHRKLIE